jgi:hypothetical protein
MMAKNFEVVKADDTDRLMQFNGGSLKGYLRADFKILCETFGPPTYGPFDYTQDKVTCEWKIVTYDGLFVTIYDWKVGETPLGQYDWHIGGHAFENVDWVSYLTGCKGWR